MDIQLDNYVPSDLELLAGDVVLASKKLNEAMRAAAEHGVRTDVTVTEDLADPNNPATSLRSRAVYVNCYQREEVACIWTMIDLDRPLTFAELSVLREQAKRFPVESVAIMAASRPR